MPIDRYYHGHGDEVMADLVRRHGKKKGKEVFYATANTRHQTPARRRRRRHSLRALKDRR